MSNEEFINQFNSLPPEGQRLVIDLIASLKERYEGPLSVEQQELLELAEEGFIGMWQDRQDMQDSNAWVRAKREHEWVK